MHVQCSLFRRTVYQTIQIQNNTIGIDLTNLGDITAGNITCSGLYGDVQTQLSGVFATIPRNGLVPFVIFVSIEYILTIPNDYVFISLFLILQIAGIQRFYMRVLRPMTGLTMLSFHPSAPP